MLRLVFALCLVLPALAAPALHAQGGSGLQPRFGVGLEAVGTMPGQGIIAPGFGLGLRGRIALPLNADLSGSLGTGFIGYVFQGRDDASYLFNPQASLIVTIPSGDRAKYVLGGVGGFVPLSADDPGTGGFALHLGLGWARPLSETSTFFEINPSLIIGERASTPVLAARFGVIF